MKLSDFATKENIDLRLKFGSERSIQSGVKSAECRMRASRNGKADFDPDLAIEMSSKNQRCQPKRLVHPVCTL